MMSASQPEVQEPLELHPDAAREWRKAQYEEMGFSESEALALAKAVMIDVTGDNKNKLEWKLPLDWKTVKKALSAGCDHKTALEIFL
jgi:hypothetical protein